jgi:4-hydroxy-tetrahydrodipicolinate reductase
MIKIILNGCNGKMGHAITKLVQEHSDISIVAGIDVFGKNSGEFPVFSHAFDCDIDADVIIDFSRPDAISKIVSLAQSKKIPLVIATTGLEQKHHDMILELSKEVPVLQSANMSLGINVLIELVKKAATILENGFDIEIVERHHNQKVDAPSGTALMIADEINNTLGQTKEYVYDRQPKKEKRETKEIGIHAVRGGTIVGEHSVIFAGYNEVIEINHTAYSRELFANGALQAAIFLSKQKKSGLYSMKDLVQDNI